MRFKATQTEPAQMDMTPMIDIVFQLITFFVFTLSFTQSQADERVQLPSAELARPADQPPEEPLTINIGYERRLTADREAEIIPDESYPADPLHPWVFWQDELLRIDQLGPRLRSERRLRMMLARGGGDSVEETTVIIRADADVPGGAIQQLIHVCQQEGFEQFILRAESEETPP